MTDSNRLRRCVRIAAGFLAFSALQSLLTAPLHGALPEKAEQIVDYQIWARLDPKLKQIDGRETVTWRNTSPDTVQELWFHLYLNAFKNTKSTFMRESGGQLRSDQVVEGKWGWIDIKSIKLADGADLSSRLSFRQPDDGNRDDQTVCAVSLPKPVEPGREITLQIAFQAQLPQVFARSGYYRDFYLVAQWFPKLGVYEPAGFRGREQGGWNCHQYHAHSEFYADFGRFRVEITVPSNFVVGAVGVQRSRRQRGDGTTIYAFEQENIHDFAWTADPDYQVVRRRFSAAQDVTQHEYESVARLLGRSLEEVRLSDVDIILLMQPAHLRQAPRYEAAARLALKWFGLRYGRYPYATLTVVDPPYGASGAGGMEYPTLITAGTLKLLGYWPFDRIRAPELVTVHEAGHNWWYGLTANNEFEEAWLDEGINSYATGKALQMAYGADAMVVDFLGVRLGEIEGRRAQNSPSMKFDAVLKNSWSYHQSYSFYSYTKPALALSTLENYLGEKTMARIMRTFHESWRFRHPSTRDFVQIANEVSGRDLGWFFDQVFRGTNILDYEIAKAVSEPVAGFWGVFDDREARTTVGRSNARGKFDKKAPRYRTEIIVRRRGEVVFPVEVLLQFEQGPPVRKRWDGRERWMRWRLEEPRRLLYAQVDPDHKVCLDVDWSNNSRRVSPDPRAAAKWASRVLFWMGNALSVMTMF